MSSAATPLSAAEGPGSVSGAPHLPAGFTDTFASRYIDMLAALTAFVAPYRDAGTRTLASA